jgi:hypothetical protein
VTDPRSTGGGGLTAATGDLTPPDTDDAFDPGERREAEDPEHRADVTLARSGAGRAGIDPASTELSEEGPTDLASQDGGYGSTGGLAGDDPAYRMEEGLSPKPSDEASTARPRIGADQLADHEERF